MSVDAGRLDRDVHVPRVLRTSAALGWRFLVVVAALYVVGWVAGYLAAVVVPVAIALLLAALLSPAVHRLQEHNVPRGVATTLVMVGGLALLGGVLTFVVATFVRGVPDLGSQLTASVNGQRGRALKARFRLSGQGASPCGPAVISGTTTVDTTARASTSHPV